MPYLQSLGVRYVMVRTDEAKRSAEGQPELTLLATSGPWEIFEVADSEIVQPLTVQPVVVDGRDGDQRERNLELGTSWFQHRDEWAAIPADDGPASWQRIHVDVDQNRLVPDPNAAEPDTRGKQVDIVVPREPIEPVALAPVTVTDVVIDEQDLSFHVDQVGVPVIVKVSYFPNWTAHGAEGPYRIAPNLMVVVPTSQDVSMTFDRSSSDLLFYGLTGLGIALLVVLRIRGDTDLGAPAPLAVVAAGGAPGGDDPFGPPPVWSSPPPEVATWGNGHARDDPPPDPWSDEAQRDDPASGADPGDVSPDRPLT